MNKEQKNQAIDALAETLSQSSVLYLADTSGLSVENTNKLRRVCFEKKISMQVVKNTLLKKAMERNSGKNFQPLYDALKGATSIMICETPSDPAKVIRDFRKNFDKPILKAAYIDEATFIGDNQVAVLASLKTKNELIGEVIALLQSPAKNVVSALKSGNNKLAGIVKTLSERPE